MGTLTHFLLGMYLFSLTARWVISAGIEPICLLTINAAGYIDGNIPRQAMCVVLNTDHPPATPTTHYFVTYRLPCEKDGVYAIWLVGGGSGHYGKSRYLWSIDGSPFQSASNNALVTPETKTDAFDERRIEICQSVKLPAGEHRLSLRVEHGTSGIEPRHYAFSLKQVMLTPVWVPEQMPLSPHLAIRNGDKVCFIGDSISTSGLYIKDVTTVFARAFPDATIRFFNCDNPGDTTVNGLERMERDVLVMKPSWVVIALGINDVRDITLYQYHRNMQDMINRSKAIGARVMLLTPTVYDEDPSKQSNDTTGYVAEMLNNEAVRYHNRALSRMTEEIIAMAKTYDCLVADVHTPFRRLIEERRIGKHPLDLLPDRLHPSEDGHMVIALAVLKGFGMTNVDIERSGLDIPIPVQTVFGLNMKPVAKKD